MFRNVIFNELFHISITIYPNLYASEEKNEKVGVSKDGHVKPLREPKTLLEVFYSP